MKEQMLIKNLKITMLVLAVMTLVMTVICSVLLNIKGVQEDAPKMSVKVLEISAYSDEDDTKLASKKMGDEVNVETNQIAGKEKPKLNALAEINGVKYINRNNVVVLKLEGTDDNYKDNTLAEESVIVKVDGQIVEPGIKQLGDKSILDTGITCDLTLANIPGNGELTIEIAADTLEDKSTNKNILTTFDSKIIIDNESPIITASDTVYGEDLIVSFTDLPSLVSAWQIVEGVDETVLEDGWQEISKQATTSVNIGKKDVGAYTIWVKDGVGNTNHKSINITKKTISPTVNMSDYVYGGVKSEPSISGNIENGAVEYYYNVNNQNNDGSLWNTVTDSISLPVGKYYMYATVAETENYFASITETKEFNIISKKLVERDEQTGEERENVDITNIENVTYNGLRQTQDLKVTDKILNQELIKDEDYTLSYENNINAGIATVIITGKGNYQGTISRTFTINKKEIEVVWNDQNVWEYDGNLHVATLEENPIDGENNEKVELEVYGAKTNAGEYEANASILDVEGGQERKENYELINNVKQFEIVAKNFKMIDEETEEEIETIDVNNIFDVTYTGIAQEQNPEVIDKALNKKLTENVDYTVSYENNVNAGTATVIITGTGNYQGVKQVYFQIRKREITITSGSASKIYDGSELTKNEVKLTDGELAENQTFMGTASGTIINTGKVPNIVSVIVIQDASNNDVSDNYEITIEEGELEIIAKELTVTAISKTKAYGEENPVLDYTYIGQVNGQNPAFTGGLETTATKTSPVGIYPITKGDLSLSDNGEFISYNYTLNYVGANLIIADQDANTFTVTLNQTTYEYDGTAKTPIVTVKDGEKELEQDIDYEIEYKNNINAGTATVKVIGKENYTGIKEVTFSITPIRLTVTASSASKVYDGSALTKNEFNITEGQLVDGQIISGTTSGSIIDVGETPNALTVVTVKDANNNDMTTNYDITKENGTLEVTPRELTVTANKKTKVYGTANPTLDYTYSGEISGETPDFSGGLTTTATVASPVGTYPITNNNLTLKDKSPFLAKNYLLKYVGNDLTVTGKSVSTLTMTLNQTSYEYDGTAKTPTETIKDGGIILTRETHYTVEYSNNINAGNNTAKVIITGKGNYAGTKELTFSITKRNITVTASNATKIYDGNALRKNEVKVTSGQLADNQTFTGTTSGTITDVGEKDNVVSTVIIKDNLNNNVSKNYEIRKVNGTLKITPRILTVTADEQTKTFGEPNPELTYKYSGAVTGEIPGFEGALTTTATQSSSIGTYEIKQGTLGLKDNLPFLAINYTLNYVGANLEIESRNSFKVTLGQNVYTYDGTEKKPIVTVKDGNDTLTENTHYTVEYVNNKNAGTGKVIVTGIGDYSARKESTFTINPKELTVTATNVSRIFGADNPTFEYTYAGNVTGETPAFTGTLSTTANPTSAVGTYDITQGDLILKDNSPFLASNYSLKYVKGTLTVNQKSAQTFAVTLSKTSYEYDGTEKKPTAIVKDDGSALTEGTDYTVSYSNNINAGTNTAKVTITGKGNYTGTKEVTFTITQKTLTVTAAAKSKTYGAANPELTYTYSGQVSGQTPKFTGALTTSATETSAAGTYDITQGTLALADNSAFLAENYKISYVKASLTINGKNASTFTVTLDKSSYEYDGTAKTPTATVKDGTTTLTKDTNYTVSYSNNTNAGTNTAKVTITGKGNYTGTKEVTFTITQKTLTVTAAAKSKTYGAANPELTYTYSGQVSGQTPKFTGALTTSATTTSAVGTYDITQGTLTLADNSPFLKANYKISYVKAGLTINAKNASTFTVTLDKTSYEYDGTAKTPTATVKNGTTTLTKDTHYTVSYSNNTNAGTNTAKVTITGKGNYTGTKEVTFTITQKTLTVTAAAKSKTYGAANPELTYTYSGQISGQTPKFTGALATTVTATTAVGSYDITQGTLVLTDNSTFLAANYKISYTKASLTISKRVITVTASSASKTYDGNALTKNEVKVTSGTLASNQTFTGTASGTITNVGTADNTVATAVVKNSSGTDVSSNYTITKVKGTLTVSQRTLTVTAAAKSKTYGAANPSLTYTYSGQVSGQTPKFTGALTTSATVTSAVGSYDITQGTLALADNSPFLKANYKIAYVKASLSVTVLSLTVPAQSGTLTYNKAEQSPTWNSNYITSRMTLGGTTKGINTTSYNATFTLKDTTNTKWSDGTTAAKTVAWKISPYNLSNATIANIAEQSHTGSAIKPTPAVTVPIPSGNTTTLTNNTDFTYSYSNNTNVGTGTVTVKGKGNYTGTKSKTFAIKDKTKPTIKVTAYKYVDATTNNHCGDLIQAEQTFTSDGTYTVKSGSWINYGATFKFTFSDNVGVTAGSWTWNANATYTDTGTTYPTDNTGTISSTEVTNKVGYHTLTGQGWRKAKYMVKDAAGNSTTITVVVKIDDTKPTVKVTAYKYNADATYEVGTQVKAETTFTSNGTFTVSSNWLNYGITFKFVSTDNVGVTKAEWKWNTLGVYTDSGSTYSGGPTTFTDAGSEGGTGIRYRTLTGHGYRKAQYTVTDSAGNSITITVVVKIDDTKPTIKVTGLKDGTTTVAQAAQTFTDNGTFTVKSGSWINYGVDFKFEVTDSTALASGTWKWNTAGVYTDSGSTYSGGSAAIETTELSDKTGTHGLTGAGWRKAQYTVKDAAGNSTTITVVVKIDTSAPGKPTNVVANIDSSNKITLTFTAPSADTGGGISGYQVYKSDGTTTVGSLTNSTTIAISGNTGWYTNNYVVKTKDGAGNYSAAAPISYYTVKDTTGLKGFATSVNSGGDYSGRTVKCAANITFSSGDESWIPIGKNSSYPFKGTFEGQNKTIKTLKMSAANSATYPYRGMFGYVSNATIRNIDVTVEFDATTSTNFSSVNGPITAGITAEARDASTIYNCDVHGWAKTTACSSKNGYSYVGGIVGYAGETTVIEACDEDAIVTGKYGDETSDNAIQCRTGGIAGSMANTVTIKNCEVSNGVNGQYITGGIVSYANGIVDNCRLTTTAKITDSAKTSYVAIGGVAGQVGTNGIVRNCIVNCHSINANQTSSGDASRAGGIAGINYGTIEKCGVKNLTMTEALNYLGGIAGENKGQITSCYVRGCTIPGENHVAGITGFNDKDAKVTGCYCSGTCNITGELAVAGLVGENQGTIEYSYTTTYGKIGSKYYMICGATGGTQTRAYYDKSCGKTNATSSESSCTKGELKTLPAWEKFNSYYKIDSSKINSGYPILLWENTTTPNTAYAYYSRDTGTVSLSTDKKVISSTGNYGWVYLHAGAKFYGTYASGASGFTYYIPGTGSSTHATVPSASGSAVTITTPVAIRIPAGCKLNLVNKTVTLSSLD